MGNSTTEMILNVTPVCQILFIILALFWTLWKLRCFQKMYQLDVDRTKLITHVFVVLLLLLLFVVDFFA